MWLKEPDRSHCLFRQNYSIYFHDRPFVDFSGPLKFETRLPCPFQCQYQYHCLPIQICIITITISIMEIGANYAEYQWIENRFIPK